MSARLKCVLLLAALAAVAIYSREITDAAQALVARVLIYLIVFLAGWLLGRLTGRRPRRSRS